MDEQKEHHDAGGRGIGFEDKQRGRRADVGRGERGDDSKGDWKQPPGAGGRGGGGFVKSDEEKRRKKGREGDTERSAGCKAQDVGRLPEAEEIRDAVGGPGESGKRHERDERREDGSPAARTVEDEEGQREKDGEVEAGTARAERHRETGCGKRAFVHLVAHAVEYETHEAQRATFPFRQLKTASPSGGKRRADETTDVLS